MTFQKQLKAKDWLKRCIMLVLINLYSINLVYGFEYTPKNLLEEKNISKECMRKLFYEGYINREDLKSLTPDDDNSAWGQCLEWKYIGSIGEYHVIYTQIEGDTWWIHSLNVIKFLEDGIIVTSSVDGPRRSEILGSAIIKDNRILYSQMTNGYGFFHYVTEHNSHLKMLFPEICGELHDLRGAIIGFFEYDTQLDNEGKVHSGKITAFTPSEGWPPYSGKVYSVEDCKELFLQLCKRSDG